MKSLIAFTAVFVPCIVSTAEVHKCKAPDGSITYSNTFCGTTQDELDIANRATKPLPQASEVKGKR